jgi:cytochrome c-type biogenesis protein CcmE
MNKVRRQKLLWLVAIACGLTVAVVLVLYALRDNINAFYAPHDVAQGVVQPGETFRIGGLVVENSVRRTKDGLTVQFALTDERAQVTVLYTGVLPDLFREGQGIVALGELNAQQQFVATQVLAKHDATYMPPEVQQALAAAASS